MYTDVVLGVLIFLGLLAALLWLLNRPDDNLDEEGAAGLVAGTWPAARDVVFGEEDGDGER